MGSLFDSCAARGIHPNPYEPKIERIPAHEIEASKKEDYERNLEDLHSMFTGRYRLSKYSQANTWAQIASVHWIYGQYHESEGRYSPATKAYRKAMEAYDQVLMIDPEYDGAEYSKKLCLDKLLALPIR